MGQQSTRLRQFASLLLALLLHATLLAAPGDIIQIFSDPEGGQEDQFGYSVGAVHGGTAVVGAPAKPGGGAVFLFYPERSSPFGQLALPAGYTPGRFGDKLATTGSQILVSDPEAPLPGGGKGAVLVYASARDTNPKIINNPDPTTTSTFGVAVAFGPNGRLAISNPEFPIGKELSTGRVYVYDSLPTSPTLLYTLDNPGTATWANQYSSFGDALAFSEMGHLAVGAPAPRPQYRIFL